MPSRKKSSKQVRKSGDGGGSWKSRRGEEEAGDLALEWGDGSAGGGEAAVVGGEGVGELGAAGESSTIVRVGGESGREGADDGGTVAALVRQDESDWHGAGEPGVVSVEESRSEPERKPLRPEPLRSGHVVRGESGRREVAGKLPFQARRLSVEEAGPRQTAADSFEQNPLSGLANRVMERSIETMSDSERVREALRDLVERRGELGEVARTWQVAQSALVDWQRRYRAFLEQEVPESAVPLVAEAGLVEGADLVTVPEVAREMFQANWDRLMEQTKAGEESFRQSPLRLFLENSWMTGWLYTDGELDRNSLAGLVVALLAVVAVGGVLRSGRLVRAAAVLPAAVAEVVESDEQVIARAAEVAQRFFRAEATEEKLALLRGGEEARQLAREHFKAHGPEVFADAALSYGMTSRGITSLEFEVPSRQSSVLLNVVERGGAMLIDWETSSLYQRSNLEGLREKRPRDPVRVAVKVARGDYWNYGFNEAGHGCYRMSYPGLVLDLFGYVARDSRDHVALEALLSAKEFMGQALEETVVLEVRYPRGAVAANQVEIVRMVKDQWVTD